MKSMLATGLRLGPWLRWLVWLTYTVAWTAALLTPQPVEVADRMLSADVAFLSSKGLHIASYAMLAVLSGWLRVPRPSRWLLLGFLSFHALGTEFFQGFVPQRTPSLRDVGLDYLGIILGLAATWKWWSGRR